MPKRTIQGLTEGGFHERLRHLLRRSQGGELPLGDDCAAVPLGRKRSLLITTDAVVEGTHFPSGTEPERVGRLAANVNLSDLAAKGGEPRGLVSALLLPPDTEVDWAEGVTAGIEAAARKAGTHLLGGDTKRGRERAVIIGAFGEGRSGHLMPRRAARVGDLLVTTGRVGRGGAAYLAWKEGWGPRRASLHRLLAVSPRLREGRALCDFAHATLDTSDGLARSMRLLADASRVSVSLWFDRLPLDPWVSRISSELDIDPAAVALLGGDYELLSAIPPARVDAARKAVRKVSGDLTVVGQVEPRGPHQLIRDGRRLPLPDVGWDAFAVVP